MGSISTYMTKRGHVRSMQSNQAYKLIMKNGDTKDFIFHEYDLYQLTDDKTKGMELDFNLGIDFLVHLNERFGLDFDNANLYALKVRDITVSDYGSISFNDTEDAIPEEVMCVIKAVQENKATYDYISKFGNAGFTLLEKLNIKMEKIDDISSVGRSLRFNTPYVQFFDNDKIIEVSHDMEYKDIKMSHHAFEEYKDCYYEYSFSDIERRRAIEFVKYSQDNIEAYFKDINLDMESLSEFDNFLLIEFRFMMKSYFDQFKMAEERLIGLYERAQDKNANKAIEIMKAYDAWYDDNCIVDTNIYAEFEKFDSVNPIDIKNVNSDLLRTNNWYNNYKLLPTLILVSDGDFDPTDLLSEKYSVYNEAEAKVLRFDDDDMDVGVIVRDIIKDGAVIDDNEFNCHSVAYVDEDNTVYLLEGIYEKSKYSNCEYFNSYKPVKIMEKE